MAVKYELIITINKDGEVVLKTIGFKGNECDEELNSFVPSLGKFTDKKRTKEFYEKSQKNKRKIRSKTK